jgi:hypothetical protein
MDIKQLPSYDEQLTTYLKAHPDTSIIILTPCYNGELTARYGASMIDTSSYLTKMGVKYTVQFVSDSLVTRSRNNLIGKSMGDSTITHMLFIDADITFHPHDIVKLLVTDKDVIGGIYPLKKYNWNQLQQSEGQNKIRDLLEIKKNNSIFDNMSDEEFIQKRMVRYNLNPLKEDIIVVDSMIEVYHIATGFMMIKRNVIEKMVKEYPETKYTDNMGFLKTEEEKKWAYALFDCAISKTNNTYLSEDWLFCERWRNIGGQIIAHVGIDLDHTGTETFSGSFLTSLV